MNYSPTEETPMNLLTSSFVPNNQGETELHQLQYGSNPSAYTSGLQQYVPDNAVLQYASDNTGLQYASDTRLQYASDTRLPYAISNGLAYNTDTVTSQEFLNNPLPSPQFDMTNNYEFISHSPGSSSSNESNLLVSPPPQQYIPLRRSSSVPPHTSHFKPDKGMYNQFQLKHPMPSKRPLPVQIPRVHQTQMSKPTTEAQRQKLDEKLERVNFDDITVAELKEMLRERGLSATGRKAELLRRLKGEYETLKRGSPIHRRVAHLNLDNTQRSFEPYSPPYQYASSVPDQHTPSLFLNDQYMKPCLFKQSFEKDPTTDVWDDQKLQDFLNQI